MRSVDLFSCLGCHAIGFGRAGIRTIELCEVNEHRRRVLAARFPGVPIHDDIGTWWKSSADILGGCDVVIGGPPCQETSVASAIHGYRSGASLWAEMLSAARMLAPDWIVVEQPPGHAAWETKVADDLRDAGRYSARVEFSARDCGAPYLRRRVFILACASLPRLEVAWSAVPQAIADVARAANARGDWSPDKLAALRMDARSAGEMERSESAIRRERIEALGDSNPPHMAEVIGRAIVAASAEV